LGSCQETFIEDRRSTGNEEVRLGRHASQDSRRRLAAWPVIAAVAVVVVAALVIGYFLVLNKDRGTAACTGSTVLPVTAAPGAAPSIADAAQQFSSTAPVARGTCVSVRVTTTAGAAVAQALSQNWKGQTSPAPALWVVDSTADIATLDADNSAMTAGHSVTALATSPVVLAVRERPGERVGSWHDVAAGSNGLVLAVPDPVKNRASGDALESIVAGMTQGGSQTGITAAAVTAATPLLGRLAARVPNPPATTEAALLELASRTTGFSAVPVVESDLAAFNATHPPGLTALYPTGRTAADQILPVPLTASWVTDAMSDAAAAFDAFLGDPKGVAILTRHHLRTGTAAVPAPGVDLTTKVAPLLSAPAPVARALKAVWASATGSTPLTDSTPTAGPSLTPRSTLAATSTASATSKTTTTRTAANTPTAAPAATRPSQPTTAAPGAPVATNPGTSSRSSAPPEPGLAITLLVDTSESMNTVQGNLQRIMWTQAAVTAAVSKNQQNSFGLWSFSTREGGLGYDQRVPLGGPAGARNAAARTAALIGAANGLTVGGASWTYAAIQAAYTDAVTNAVAGRKNRMIVLTDGGDTTPGLSRDALKGSIAALRAQNGKVTLDIVGLSAEVTSPALSEIAAAGGGTFTLVDNLADLQPTLLTLMAG